MADDILTSEEKKQIEKDIQDVKKSLDSSDKQKAVDSAKLQVKQELEKEYELKQRLQQQEETNKALTAKLEAEAKAREEMTKKFQAQFDEMRESKASVQLKNPFKAEDFNVEKMTPEVVDAIEEASKEAFFSERQKP